MKISKTALLAISGALSIAGLGLMFVSADKDLRINPRNAVQHIETVKFISGSTTATATLKQLGNRLVGIETNNFVLSEDDSSNEIKNQLTEGASILGGGGNKIGKNKVSKYSVILGGVRNTIDNGYSTILGGEGNKINGAESTILGGKDNGVVGGSSVIVGGHDNDVNGGKSVVVGSNSSVNGDLSAALGVNSHVEASKAFLWTDGTHDESESLGEGNVFAVAGGSGMVIGTNQAHSFAQLTLNGGLVIRKGGSNLQCIDGNKGSLKVVNVRGDPNKICLCSCDGDIWNSMFGLGQCKSACDDKYVQPKCGDKVVKICIGNETVYSGSCEPGKGVVVEGTGAYFVDKRNKVHWSCQTDDALVVQCSHELTEDHGCRAEGVQYYCGQGDHPGENGQNYRFGATTYPVNYPKPTWHRVGDNVTELNACEWRCNVESGYVWDSTANNCIFKTATLTYNANNCGNAPSPNPVTMTFTAETKAVGMTATNGRSFTKWCEHSNGSAPCYNSGDTVKAANVVPTAKTLYAQCTAEPTATLTYNANGCGTAPDSVTMTYSTETKAATSMKTINQGWTLNKWCTQNNGGGTCYDKGESVKAANVSPTPLTLYAQCTAPCTRTIKYNANGGTPTPSEQSVTCGNSETLASAPTKQGYAFGGWKSSENSQIYEAGASYTPSASTVTMTAQWTDNENTLTVNPNGGKVIFDGAERTSSHSVTKKPGATIIVPNASGKSKSVESAGRYSIKYEGAGGEPVPSIQYAARTKTTTYTFNKWNDSANCGIMNGTTYTFPSSNGTTCTKTAQWSSSEEYKTDSVTLGNEPTREGYTFAGWKSSTDGQVYPAGSSYTPTADTTMTAQWTTCSYKITYKPNGGKFSDGSTNDKVVNVSCGQSTTLVSGLKKEGYRFTNWKLDGVSINAYYNEGKTYTPTKDVTFIAQWTDNENTLTVNPNGGKVIFDGAERTSSHSVTKKAGTTITVPNASRSNSIESDGTYTVSYDTDGGTSQTPSEQRPAIKRKTTYTFNKWDNAGTACGGMNGTTYTFPPYDGTTCTKTANWTTNTTYSTESVTLADAPTKPNCEFKGWKSSTNNVTYTAGSSYTPTANTTMTAQWSCTTTKTFTATFKANGNEIYDVSRSQYTTSDIVLSCTTQATSCTVTSPAIKKPSDGYAIGWSAGPDNHDSEYNATTAVTLTANKTLYAQANHKKTLKLTLSKDNTIDSIDKTSETCDIVRYNGDTPSTSCSVTLPGCTPKTCYQNCKFGSYSPGASYTMSSNSSLTAGASIKKFTITYNPDGGKWPDGTTSNKPFNNVNCGNITLESAPNKNGHNFLGWYNGSNRVGGGGDTYNLTQNITLIAKWEKEQATCVNYDQYKECSDGITGTPTTGPDSDKVYWMCGSNKCVMCNESAGYHYQGGSCVKDTCPAPTITKIEGKKVYFNSNGGDYNSISIGFSETNEGNWQVNIGTNIGAPSSPREFTPPYDHGYIKVRAVCNNGAGTSDSSNAMEFDYSPVCSVAELDTVSVSECKVSYYSTQFNEGGYDVEVSINGGAWQSVGKSNSNKGLNTFKLSDYTAVNEGTESVTVSAGTLKLRRTKTYGGKTCQSESNEVSFGTQVCGPGVCGIKPTVHRYRGTIPNYTSAMYNGYEYWFNYDCQCNVGTKKWICERQLGSFWYGGTLNSYNSLTQGYEYHRPTSNITEYSSAGNVYDGNATVHVGTCRQSVYDWYLSQDGNRTIGTTNYFIGSVDGATACALECNLAHGGTCDKSCFMAFNCMQLTPWNSYGGQTYRCGPQIVIDCKSDEK